MTRRVSHRIRNHLLAALVLLVVGGVLGYLAQPQEGPPDRLTQIVAAVCLLAAFFNVLRTFMLMRNMGRGLDWIHTTILNIVAGRATEVPAPQGGCRVPEIEVLLQALDTYQKQINRDREAPNERLLAILRVLNSGVVVITEDGQVSLVNGVGQDLLGAERVRVGTSLFASLSRESVIEALGKARRKGGPFETLFQRLDGAELGGRISPLPDGEGAIILFPPSEVTRHRPALDFDLTLHDVPPDAEALGLDTPLDELPMLIIDTETTGLLARTDRIVSFGGVCAHGGKLYRSRMIDDLVNPGQHIPSTSTAIHGITDAMVADARAWPEIYAEFLNLARGRVIVGHSIPFDLTIMKYECERHGLPWADFIFIDTLRLASLLNPTMKSFDLEDLAGFYQIDLHGRHTALGDALVCAELFFRMMPRLQMQGFTTLGELLRFHCRQAVEIIAKQREAGWIIDQPADLRGAGDQSSP